LTKGCLPWIFVSSLAAQTTDAEQFFESKVRPVLANNCYTCHTGAPKSCGLGYPIPQAIPSTAIT
jgi:hypothetical protein